MTTLLFSDRFEKFLLLLIPFVNKHVLVDSVKASVTTASELSQCSVYKLCTAVNVKKTVFSLKGCALYCTCVILFVIDVTVVHIGPKNIILNDDILFMS